MYAAQVGICCHDYNESDFQKGKRHAYMDCLKMLDTLEQWHQYPKEKPTDEGMCNKQDKEIAKLKKQIKSLKKQRTYLVELADDYRHMFLRDEEELAYYR